MVEIDSEEYRHRMAAFSEKMCVCGHAFGNHSLFSGCMLCPCGCTREKERTVVYTRLTDPASEKP